MVISGINYQSSTMDEGPDTTARQAMTRVPQPLFSADPSYRQGSRFMVDQLHM